MPRRAAEIFSIITDRHPHDVGTRQRAVRHLVQMGDFHSARRIAWHADPFLADGGPPSAEQVDQLDDGRGLESWLYAIHAELAFHGRMVESHRVKRRIAEVDADRRINRNSPIAHVMSVIQATLYLDGAETALQRLHDLTPRFRDPDRAADAREAPCRSPPATRRDVCDVRNPKSAGRSRRSRPRSLSSHCERRLGARGRTGSA